jgi:hypothetical protein
MLGVGCGKCTPRVDRGRFKVWGGWVLRRVFIRVGNLAFYCTHFVVVYLSVFLWGMSWCYGKVTVTWTAERINVIYAQWTFGFSGTFIYIIYIERDTGSLILHLLPIDNKNKSYRSWAVFLFMLKDSLQRWFFGWFQLIAQAFKK